MYTTEQVEKLSEVASTVKKRARNLIEQYYSLNFTSNQAKEFALQGFGRRVSNLSSAIQQIYDAIPPDYQGTPSKEQRSSVEIGLHAFFANLAGCFDNLAWIYVYEKNLTIKNQYVGISHKHKQMLSYFSDSFRLCISEMESWFNHLKSFRDSLVHRIPLYIPPYAVPDDKIDLYNELSARKFQIPKSFDEKYLEEQEEIEGKLGNIVRFEPVYNHSWIENPIPINFHAQVLADFATIEQLANDFLGELNL